MITRYAARSGFFGLGISMRSLLVGLFVLGIVGAGAFATVFFPDQMIPVFVALCTFSMLVFGVVRLVPTLSLIHI